MGKHSGESARRSTLPALLDSGAVRRCVNAGLLPTTVFRASGPTPEFCLNYYGSKENQDKAERRYSTWVDGEKISFNRRARAIRRIQKKRSGVEQGIREELLQAQEGICYLCGNEMSALEATLEHVTPRSLGGKNLGNLLVAHGVCNQRKADRAPHEHELAYLKEINLKRLEMIRS